MLLMDSQAETNIKVSSSTGLRLMNYRKAEGGVYVRQGGLAGFFHINVCCVYYRTASTAPVALL